MEPRPFAQVDIIAIDIVFAGLGTSTILMAHRRGLYRRRMSHAIAQIMINSRGMAL